jgi:hypothetical protein
MDPLHPTVGHQLGPQKIREHPARLPIAYQVDHWVPVANVGSGSLFAESDGVLRLNARPFEPSMLPDACMRTAGGCAKRGGVSLGARAAFA